MEENDVHTFPTIWNIFLAFENLKRTPDEGLDDFIRRWQESLGRAQSAGCGYSDTLLACKLLQQANLDELVVKSVVNSIACGKTEMLCTLLCTLEDYSGRKFDRERIIAAGHSEPNGNNKDFVRGAKSRDFSDEQFTPQIELDDHIYEISQSVIQLDSTNKIRHLTKNHFADTSGISSQNDSEGYSSASKDPLAIDQDNFSSHVPEHRQNDALVKGRRVNGEKRRLPRPSVDDTSSTEEVLEEMVIDVKQEPIGTCQGNFQPANLQNVYHEANVFEKQKKTGQRVSETVGDETRQANKDESMFKCTYCNYYAEGRTDLKSHMEFHFWEDHFKCPYCDKPFGSSKQMSFHIRVIHGEMGKIDSSLFYFKHAGSGQSSERRLQCPHCDYSTLFKKLLARHVRRHNEETPFNCEICGKRYFTKHSARRHMKLVHGQ